MKKNLTILYVEDDTDTRNIVTRILQKSYVEVLVAEDGAKGLETYLGTKPDIVLSDISMPNMDGLEMCARIKELNPNQVIGLFTAFNEPDYQKRSSELGIDTYILKPLDEKRFFNALHYLDMLVDA